MPDTPDSQVPQPSSSQPSAPPLQPAAASPPAPYRPLVAPPAKKGSSALKIVLIIVGIFFGLGLLAAGVIGYGVYKVVHSVHMADSSQPVTERELGVPIYPGAAQGKGAMRMTLAGKAMTTANFLTPDSKEQVIAFYQRNIGPVTSSSTTSFGTTLASKKGSGETVSVTISQNPSLHNGETQIVIVHAANASSGT